jgi:hypothetical protein
MTSDELLRCLISSCAVKALTIAVARCAQVEADTTLQIYDSWWFHEPNKGGPIGIRTLAELQTVYHSTVGQNAFLELDFAPTPEGLIAPDQAARYKEFVSHSRLPNQIDAMRSTATSSNTQHQHCFDSQKTQSVTPLAISVGAGCLCIVICQCAVGMSCVALLSCVPTGRLDPWLLRGGIPWCGKRLNLFHSVLKQIGLTVGKMEDKEKRAAFLAGVLGKVEHQLGSAPAGDTQLLTFKTPVTIDRVVVREDQVQNILSLSLCSVSVLSLVSDQQRTIICQDRIRTEVRRIRHNRFVSHRRRVR